jgi:hypothetical protein
MFELSKFDELRIKTENQLVRLMDNQLDRGIRDARYALSSADSRVVAEEFYLRANRARAEVSLLISLTAEISADERSRVECRLNYLTGLLERALEAQNDPSSICVAS